MSLFGDSSKLVDDFLENRLFRPGRSSIKKIISPPRFTLFTTFKSFSDSHSRLIQTNAIRSWMALKPAPEILVIGSAPGTKKICKQFGLNYIPLGEKKGPPLISHMFTLARRNTNTDTLVYVNGDILLENSINDIVAYAKDNMTSYLLLCQRYNVDVRSKLAFNVPWQKKLLDNAIMHPPTGKDCFIFNKSYFSSIPHFRVGRAVWDDWILNWALSSKKLVFDVTGAMKIFHQNHERKYSWSKLTDKHSKENLKLAGNSRADLMCRITDIPKKIVCVRKGDLKDFYISD